MDRVEVILQLDPSVEPHVPAKTPWNHRGQAGRTKAGTSAIRLTYRMAHPEIEDWMLEALSHDIAGVLRHELEHGAQDKRGVSVAYGPNTGRKDPNQKDRDWSDIPATRAYLLDPAEIEAWATQAYQEAKRRKIHHRPHQRENGSVGVRVDSQRRCCEGCQGDCGRHQKGRDEVRCQALS